MEEDNDLQRAAVDKLQKQIQQLEIFKSVTKSKYRNLKTAFQLLQKSKNSKKKKKTAQIDAFKAERQWLEDDNSL